MPAELVAHRRQQLVGEGVLLTRTQALHQRSGDDRRGHVQVDRLGHGPAAFAGIFHVRRDALQRRILAQRIGAEVEQPRTHHAAVAPDLRDLVQVQAELGLAPEDGEALGIGLHHSVLDAVVDHLGEVARAAGPDPAPAALGRRRQGFEDRPQPFDRGLVAADHQAVALLQAPHAAAGAGVDVVQAVLAQFAGAAHGVLVVG
ncbi:hypothetical protein CATMIT_01710, partial [Catenibacterium mitsuokai DSM 15897]